MRTATITITDHTAAAQSLYTLLSKGSQTGYTVAPSDGLFGTSFMAIGAVAYVSVQASPTNGSGIVYKGDGETANDGTRQGKEMLAGDTDVQQISRNGNHLSEIFLRTNTDNSKINVEIHYA